MTFDSEVEAVAHKDVALAPEVYSGTLELVGTIATVMVPTRLLEKSKTHGHKACTPDPDEDRDFEECDEDDDS